MNAEQTATKESEEMLLGSILIAATGTGTDEIPYLTATVKPEDFSDGHLKPPANQRSRIYAAMLQCGSHPHQVNVAHRMVETDSLQPTDVGYMTHCITFTPTHLDLRHYADAVAAYSRRRRLRFYGNKGDAEAVRRLSLPRFTGGIRA